jgi:hypothetical protein
VVSSLKPSTGDAYGVRYSKQFGGLGLKTIDGGFTGLGLKTRVEVLRRNERHMAASGSSHRGEATGEEAWGPSDEDDTGWTITPLG